MKYQLRVLGKTPLLLSGFLVALALTLAGCGGGGGGTNTAGGIGGTGIAAGAVTKRVESTTTVNGVAFTTTSATVSVNGVTQPLIGDTSLIKPGMVVKVRGNIAGATGRATEVNYTANVKGPITGAPDAATGTFVVLGQTVKTNALTIYDDNSIPNGFSGLTGGLQVEVSGNVDASGVILATFIQAKPAGDLRCELKGKIDAVVGATSFTVETLTVDYALATLINFSAASAKVGDMVEIKAASCNGSPLILAERDTVERTTPGLGAAEGDRVEVEGLITDFVSTSSFKVTGQVIDASAATFEGGVAADLSNGRKIEAEGNIAAGILKATKIEIKSGGIPPSSGSGGSGSGGGGGGGGGGSDGGGGAEISADFDNLDPVLPQTLIILGVKVKYDNATLLKGPSGSTLDPSTLVSGDDMEVEGFANSDNSVTATHIEFKPNSLSEVTLLGPVDNDPVPSNFTILGVQVQTNGATQFNGSTGGSTAFYTDTKRGQLVKVKGSETIDNVISATKVDNED